MEEVGKNRTDRMVNSFKDTGENAMTKWGNDFINDNLPKAMDWMVDKIKSVVSSVSKSENKKMSDSIRDVIFQGIEIGEQNKERAIVLAMKKAGMTDEEINSIIANSERYLVTRKDFETRDKKK